MKAGVLRQDEERSHNPVCQLQFVSKLSTGNSSENPRVCFCKDNLILILHTMPAQQPHVTVSIFMGEPQREHGESCSQLWTQPCSPPGPSPGTQGQWKLRAEPSSQPLLCPAQHTPPNKNSVSGSKHCLCYPASGVGLQIQYQRNM